MAVVRPGNVSSSASEKLEQKHIVKNKLEMIMEVGFIGERNNLQKGINIYTARVPPTSRKGYHGLYIFEFGCKLPNFFQKAGKYRFSFHLVSDTKDSISFCLLHYNVISFLVFYDYIT